MPKMPEHHEVITFWFSEITPDYWFKKDKKVAPWVNPALRGGLTFPKVFQN